MATQQNIYLIGPMGAGKTSIGKQLASELHLQFYDSDLVIEERTGADIPWILDLEGENGFRERESKVVAELTNMQGIVLATGGGTVILPENRALLTKRGIVIYLQTSLDDQVERTSKSKKRPLSEKSEFRRETLRSMRKELEPIYKDLADFAYNTDGCSVRAMVNAIVKDLQANGHC